MKTKTNDALSEELAAVADDHAKQVEEVEAKHPLPEDSVILANKEGREAAEVFLSEQMIPNDLQNNKRFWEVIRDAAIEKVGLPLRDEQKDIRPFSDEESQLFFPRTFPRGKYADMTVAAVEKKEGLAWLKKFATNPDFFQRQLLRFVKWREKNPPKRKRKGPKK